MPPSPLLPVSAAACPRACKHLPPNAYYTQTDISTTCSQLFHKQTDKRRDRGSGTRLQKKRAKIAETVPPRTPSKKERERDPINLNFHSSRPLTAPTPPPSSPCPSPPLTLLFHFSHFPSARARLESPASSSSSSSPSWWRIITLYLQAVRC